MLGTQNYENGKRPLDQIKRLFDPINAQHKAASKRSSMHAKSRKKIKEMMHIKWHFLFCKQKRGSYQSGGTKIGVMLDRSYLWIKL